LKGGEVLISKLNPRKPRIVIAETKPQPVVASTEFIALVPREADRRFLIYWLKSEKVRQDLDGAVQSVTRSHQRVRPEQLTKMWMELPDRRMQQVIADFLDVETTRIDALIAKKRRLTTLLRQRFTSLADERVRGLLSTSRLIRLKYVVREVDKRLGSAEPPQLLLVSIHEGVLPREEFTDRLARADELSAYKRCRAGDLVLNRMRAFQGAVGRAPIPGIVSPDYSVLRPTGDLDDSFLHYVARSSWFIGEMTSRLRGIGGVGTR
jgi:type I restriction enzyme, S subunit